MLKDLSTRQLLTADFQPYEGNPIVRPFYGLIAADPCVLTPAESHDESWHLFCHTFLGVYQMKSDDGVRFSHPSRVVPRAMRPHVVHVDGRYYLYYERTQMLLPKALTLLGAKWKSSLYVTECDDLVSWTRPKQVLGHTRDFETDSRGTALSNPFLLHLPQGGYRLYYSAGQTYLPDCGFCEPTHVSCAHSDRPDRGFCALQTPLLSPDPADPYRNVGSGCVKIYRLADGYVCLQNGIFAQEGVSHSAILLYTSPDALQFTFQKILVQPSGKGDWMGQYVYASSLCYYDGTLRLYFNARDKAHPLSGRESIGLYLAKVHP